MSLRKPSAVLACVVALVTSMAGPGAARAGDPRRLPVVGGGYVLDCTGSPCVIDIAASATVIADRARPLIAGVVERFPERTRIGGTTYVRPLVEDAVQSFRAMVNAQLAAAAPRLAPTARDDIPAVGPYNCGTYLQAAYEKHHLDLLFYTQSYYTTLTGIDSILCSATSPDVGFMFFCATWGAVIGQPPFMIGAGPAFRIDGTFTDACVYGVTPSVIGPLPNGIGLVRVVIGVNAWALIGPDATYLDD